MISMARVCPYCKTVEISENVEGGVLRCHDCGRSSLPAAADHAGKALDAEKPATPPAFGLSSPAPKTKRPRDNRGAPAEIPSWPAALVGFAATGLFYGLLYMLPATGFSVLFTDRGWVPYVITLISVWALLLLGAKLLRLQSERSILGQNLIAVAADGRLGPDDTEPALAALRAEPTRIADSFLARRLERALRHFQSRRRAVELVEFLATESRADEGRVEASYGLVRVFVWAVPTLGFIGTVLGIGAAVAGFSATLDAASSLDGMKESIGLVTGGLGVAFDTTLLALVMSILIMFPASAIQRREEAFLDEVDDYCAEHLIPRLRDESTAKADEAAIAALAQRLVSSMQTSERREG
jgi:biopolymer transport protein ExbB/TolQ